MTRCRCPPTKRWLALNSLAGKASSGCLALRCKELSALLNPAISPSSPILSITAWLRIPFALLRAPLPRSQFPLFHFNVSLLLCLRHIMLFLMGLCRARMTHRHPKSLCALPARAARGGIYIHAACPLTLAKTKTQGARRGTVSPCFLFRLSDGSVQLAPHKGAVLFARSRLPAVTALICFTVEDKCRIVKMGNDW